jgi:exopolysaccharide biosynthesis polyprenyl glycosylphosphotransferase
MRAPLSAPRSRYQRTYVAAESAPLDGDAREGRGRMRAFPVTAGAEAHARRTRGRGWKIRRALLAADIAGILLASIVAQAVTPSGASVARVVFNSLLLAATLPIWIVVAKLLGLYDRDDERVDHTTAKDAPAVLQFVTVGTWILFLLSRLTSPADRSLPRLVVFWIAAVLMISLLRSFVRGVCARRPFYIQNAVVVGAGEIGQRIARKARRHPEYGLRIVGFLDNEPKELLSGLEDVPLLGDLEELGDVVESHQVDRVIFAFSLERAEDILRLARTIRQHDVQIDVVPRLFELIGPNVTVHTVEGFPLLGVPPTQISRSSRYLKRALDLTITVLALLATAPAFAIIALLIKLDSPGPVFFRQTRLGMGQRAFTALKFRTMYEGTSDEEHRAYIRSTMDRRSRPETNGLFKLERARAVTPFGRWLRRTSLDELPQLLNVLRGEMSLVGPRPCLEYELESFEEHHFDRFIVPAGITGLWQVTARANSTFAEALDMDVAYAHGWSLALDLQLLLRTPLQLFRPGVTA